MSTGNTPQVPSWYWLIAGLGLLWNLLGCAAFGAEMLAQESLMDSMTDAQKEWARSIPPWIYVVYGLAVTSGVAGSVGLLVRRRWTVLLFTVCLVAVVVQMVHTMLIAGGARIMGPSSLIMPGLVITFATALLWFAWLARERQWLGPAAQ